MNKPFLSAGDNIQCDSFDIYIGERCGDDVYMAKPIEIEKLERPKCYSEPTARISREQAKMLIDALWNAGYRPSNAVASTGQIKAMSDHLNDMRKIVALKLKCDL